MAKKKTTARKKPSKVSFSAEISDDLKKDIKNCCEKEGSCNKSSCGFNYWYWLGYIGAAIYYVKAATSFWGGVWGLIKALAWPVVLVYEFMKFLGM